MVALASKPARSFLVPTNVPATTRYGGEHATNSRSATSAFRSRVPSGSPAGRSRSPNSRGSSGAVMMAKKKGGGKKKGSAGAGAKKKGLKAPSVSSGGGSGSGGDTSDGVTAAAAVAVAEAPNADTKKVIQNRAADAEPESVVDIPAPTQISASSTAEATVRSMTATEGASSTAKGFGVPVSQPKPASKDVSSKSGGSQPNAPKGVDPYSLTEQQGGEGSAGTDNGNVYSGSMMPPSERRGDGGFDALAPGVPLAGNTDHQMVSWSSTIITLLDLVSWTLITNNTCIKSLGWSTFNRALLI